MGMRIHERARRFFIIGALLAGCGPSAGPTPPPSANSPPSQCDAAQQRISQEADQRAATWSFAQHKGKHFADHRVAWLMPEAVFQKYIVDAKATYFGRCKDGACYQFAAPTSTIQQAVSESMKDGKHDPAVLGQRLGLPARNFEGPLRLVIVDLDGPGVCGRLPVDEDPGVWKCTTPQDKDCFKFGGYTSGGLPEVMVINAPVGQAKIEQIP